MAQHDYVINNQSGAAFRADLNAALAAAVTNNSGATEPTTMYAYQWWPDTTAGMWKQRNAANTAWLNKFKLVDGELALLAGLSTQTFSVAPAISDAHAVSRVFGDGRFSALAGAATQVFSVAAATAAAHAVTAAQTQAQSVTAFTTAGTSTAFTLTPTPAITANTAGIEFDVTFHAAAGTTPTLAISGLATLALKYRDSTGALVAVTSTQVPSGWRSPVVIIGTDAVVREIPAAASGKILFGHAATIATAVATGTTTIPQDDTIPQITEGVEYITLNYIRASAASRLRIHASLQLSLGAAGNVIIALFQDSGANAIAARTVYLANGNAGAPMSLLHEMATGSTGATTFRVRAGSVSAGTVTFNGLSANRIFGGISLSGLTIEEFEV